MFVLHMRASVTLALLLVWVIHSGNPLRCYTCVSCEGKGTSMSCMDGEEACAPAISLSVHGIPSISCKQVASNFTVNSAMSSPPSTRQKRNFFSFRSKSASKHQSKTLSSTSITLPHATVAGEGDPTSPLSALSKSFTLPEVNAIQQFHSPSSTSDVLGSSGPGSPSPHHVAIISSTAASSSHHLSNTSKTLAISNRGHGSFVCTVCLLDKRLPDLNILLTRDALGQVLFENVCNELKLFDETEYFSLRYYDKHHERQWLELRKPVYPQLKHLKVLCVNFRVKHYPANPLQDMRHKITRYFLYLQLRRDLMQARLLPGPEDLVWLGALALQEEIAPKLLEGEMSEDEVPVFLHSAKVLCNQSKRQEEQILKLFSTIQDYTPEEAETKFLQIASQVETYGVHPYHALNNEKHDVYLGLTHTGVVVYEGSRRIHMFLWSDIDKMHYQGKYFEVHVSQANDKPHMKRKSVVIMQFKMDSERTAQAFWRWALDRQYFFTLEATTSRVKRHNSGGGGILRRKSTFKFQGRPQKEISATNSYLHDPVPVRASLCTSVAVDDVKRHTIGGLPSLAFTVSPLLSVSHDDLTMSPTPEVVVIVEPSSPSSMVQPTVDTLVQDLPSSLSHINTQQNTQKEVEEEVVMARTQWGAAASPSMSENKDVVPNGYVPSETEEEKQEVMKRFRTEPCSSRHVEDDEESCDHELDTFPYHPLSSSSSGTTTLLILLSSFTLGAVLFCCAWLLFGAATPSISADAMLSQYGASMELPPAPSSLRALVPSGWLETIRGQQWVITVKENVVLPLWRACRRHWDSF